MNIFLLPLWVLPFAFSVFGGKEGSHTLLPAFAQPFFSVHIFRLRYALGGGSPIRLPRSTLPVPPHCSSTAGVMPGIPSRLTDLAKAACTDTIATIALARFSPTPGSVQSACTSAVFRSTTAAWYSGAVTDPETAGSVVDTAKNTASTPHSTTDAKQSARNGAPAGAGAQSLSCSIAHFLL